MDTEKSLVEARPGFLLDLDKVDRSEWDLQMYEAALEEAGQVKFYSQWLIGKFAFEAGNKFGYGHDEELAKVARVEVGTLRMYRSVYKKFYETDSGFVPDGYMPWLVIQMAAGTENPIETLEKLQDEDATTVSKASRALKTMKTGKEVPKKPKISLVFDEASFKWRLKLKEEDIPNIDWSDVKDSLSAYFSKNM